MPATDYDYTKDGAVPFDNDDVILGDYGVATKSADEVERENSWRDMPVGEHEAVILDVQPQESKYYKVEFPDGSLGGFSAIPLKVRFCMPGDDKCTIDDYFVPPPADPNQLRAYHEGAILKEDGSPGRASWESEKYGHFLGRLGWTIERGKPMPQESRRLGNWKRYPNGSAKTVVVTVQPGRAYVNKQGVEQPGRPRVKPFSYRTSPRTLHLMGGGAGAPHSPVGSPSGGRQPAPAAHAVTSADDL